MFALASSCLLLAPGASDVHVVDAGGSGDFTEIQAAVDAAADGDLVLVRTGTYGGVVVNHKGVSITADVGEIVTITGELRVEQTLVPHVVRIAGLEVLATTDRPHALVVDTARGPLRFEDCRFTGTSAPGNGGEPGGDAVDLVWALDASFVSCVLQGGDGSSQSVHGSDGGFGLRAVSSSLALHDSFVLGGDGGDADPAEDYPGRAGHGVHLGGGVLFASGTLARGGDGGGDGFLICYPGGDGVKLVGATEGYAVDCTLEGGAAACSGGTAGAAWSVEGGATFSFLPGAARRLCVPIPVREGTQALVSASGAPGDRVYLLTGAATGFDLDLARFGVRFVTGPPAMRLLGVLPASGVLTTTLPVGRLGAGVEGTASPLQALFVETGGVARWGTPSMLLRLDGSL